MRRQTWASCALGLLPVLVAGSGQVSEVTFVTVGMAKQPLVEAVGNFPAPVVALRQRGSNFKSKVDLLDAWLRQSGLPSKALVAIFDSGDVFWGGCSPAEFVDRYRAIVAAGGGPQVVFGGELVCFEQDCRLAPAVPGGTALSWGNHTHCGPVSWTTACAEQRGCALCSDRPAMQFLNSGFMMGPAGSLANVLGTARSNYWKWTSHGDQSVFARFWHAHPELVTLDYASRLVLNLCSVRSKSVGVSRAGRVHNRVLGHVQCFIHGNGWGRPLARSLARQVARRVRAAATLAGASSPPPLAASLKLIDQPHSLD